MRCYRGTGRFTTSERPLRRIVIEHETRALLPHGLETRAWAFSSHGVDVIEPLTPLSQSPVHPHASLRFRVCCNLAVRPSSSRGSYGSEDAKNCLDHRWRLLVKADAS